MAKQSGPVRALTFEYHGIAEGELRAAGTLGKEAGAVEHRFVRLPDLREASDIAGSKFGGFPPTYIPMRNSIFYSFAASYAEETRAALIIGGHNLDDKEVFRDVGDGFFRDLQASFRKGSKILSENRLEIRRPLKELRKLEVLMKAVELGVPLGQTWSCHRTGREQCGRCTGCIARRTAFREAGVSDPVHFRTAEKIT